MKTVINHYQFNISNQIEKQNYENLKKELIKEGYDCIKTIEIEKDYMQKIQSIKEVELETEFIFNNQWNTAPINKDDPSDTGLRVFDWFQWEHPNKNYKCGYYLTITDEMKSIRENTYACNYCGKYSDPSEVFCKKCLDNEYLTEKNLKLLRLVKVADKWKVTTPELTKEELDYLLPLYKEAQLIRQKTNNIDLIQKYKNQYKEKIKLALTERNGFIWLLSKNLNVDNVIYYEHKNIFSFGWRKSIKETLIETELKSILQDFPYEWEIK